ncbi:sugar phosphate isomerase/epimerase family protein [Cohnella thermotolerans]|uniref:sugar phosphate isomerase/epimerase family protein n=1 Tax=Cohnella thermotolerans TaxID=329858 RepID=UPI00041EE2E7|nr:sugar phosphate isomerase/epimerase family protein [Cohnella thermotolerans]
MFKYSATQWIYGAEPLAASFERLHRFGYDGIELAGEPEQLDREEIKRLMERYGLICSSICGIYKPERDLSSSDRAVRANAIAYVKSCVDLAVDTGAAVVIAVPSPVGKSAPGSSAHEEWNHAAASLREAGEYAASRGIRLAIEALNRFETYLVNKLEVAKKLVEEVSVSSVGIMADLFHMNIEERNPCQAIRNIADHLVHVHIADNTREAAGLGITDFESVLRTLLEVGYKGPLTMEFLPPVSNPYAAASMKAEDRTIFDEFTRQSIDHMKALERKIALG